MDARISFQRALASTDSGLQPAAAGYSVSAYTSPPSAAASRSRVDAPATSVPVTPASFSTDGATSASDTGAAIRRAASPGAATTSGTLQRRVVGQHPVGLFAVLAEPFAVVAGEHDDRGSR